MVALVIGIGAAVIYLGTCPEVAEIQERYAYSRGKSSWSELTREEQQDFWRLRPDLRDPGLAHKNARFTSWFINWVVRPIGLFAILTAALVVSRLVWHGVKRPPGAS